MAVSIKNGRRSYDGMALTVDSQCLPGGIHLRGSLKTIDAFLEEGTVEVLVAVRDIDVPQDRG
jgi:hypothetical protein